MDKSKAHVMDYTHQMFKAWNAAFMQGASKAGAKSLDNHKLKKPSYYKRQRVHAHKVMNNMDTNHHYSNFVNRQLSNFLGGKNQ